MPQHRHRNASAKAAKKKIGRPRFLEPQLTDLVDEVPGGSDWLFEVKFDGYRALLAAAGSDVRVYTRGGLDWTHRFRSLAEAAAGHDFNGALVDGEIVVVDDEGRSDFGALQEALTDGKGELIFCAFDFLVDAGQDIRALPLLDRKARLKALLAPMGRNGAIRYTEHIRSRGQELFETLCEKGFEGIIAKPIDAPYRSGRGHGWLKIKCSHEQEFVIGGWEDSDRDRAFASILVGLNDKDGLRYAGKVGSGFSQEILQSLSRRFAKLAARRSPFSNEPPREIARRAHWLKPDLVAQIGFADFTRDGLVRQGRFHGLREDKAARDVKRET
ncbi:MAG TPA: non-homologous end-joining DNA ligase [Magnetospirillaceae bacterium]|jgi:bifunctional non-homologous end joining protein LigD